MGLLPSTVGLTGVHILACCQPGPAMPAAPSSVHDPIVVHADQCLALPFTCHTYQFQLEVLGSSTAY